MIPKDSVIAGTTKRYEAAHHINDLFSVLWPYRKISDEMVYDACAEFGKTHWNDVNQVELKEEVLHSENVHVANLREKQLDPYGLLDEIAKFNMEEILYNTMFALHSEHFAQCL